MVQLAGHTNHDLVDVGICLVERFETLLYCLVLLGLRVYDRRELDPGLGKVIRAGLRDCMHGSLYGSMGTVLSVSVVSYIDVCEDCDLSTENVYIHDTI